VPGFRAHITGSSIAGAGYGLAAWYVGDLPPMTCALGAGLCGVAGMMPDLDSGSEEPLRESVAFAAAIVPLMLIPRFQRAGMPIEGIILAGAVIYLAIRFGLAWLLSNYTQQRGMLHSLPAAAIAGQVTYLALGTEEPLRRYFISSAVVLGFLTHLVLDEIWSVQQGMFGPKFKKSFGTALKFHGPVMWSNIVSYILVILLGAVAAGDAAWTEKTSTVRQQMEQATRPYQQAPYQQWQYRR
jgi:membrane-bound metal-dependent hydrolase YbcI (DUF457 family)